MTTTEFIFNTPLYQEVTDNVDKIISELSVEYDAYVNNGIIFDGYNPVQGKESTYCVHKRFSTRDDIQVHRHRGNPYEYSAIWFCTLRCCRYGDFIDMCLWLDATRHSIMKIGQYPSVADVHIGQIKQYKSLLPKDDIKEFTRAIGLAANGVGIGSFVYMRRVFERLIQDAAKQAIEEGNVIADDFMRLRMNEKIDVLKAYLPDTLVELKDMYGILSKGLHELSETECLACFDVMRTGIELILDDKLEQKRKEEKRKKAIEAMAMLKAELKNDDINLK